MRFKYVAGIKKEKTRTYDDLRARLSENKKQLHTVSAITEPRAIQVQLGIVSCEQASKKRT